MEFLTQYGLFLAKSLTLAVVVLLTVVGMLVLKKAKKSEHPTLDIISLNEHYDDLQHLIEKAVLTKKESKRRYKEQKANRASDSYLSRPKLFVIRFTGDIKASSVETLRQEVTAILTIANTLDEVVMILESPGGMVPHYGLAASQLQRIRENNIKLTICVDRIAASGGYLMACVAHHIIAAPFAYIGSIGVIAQMPNFHELLKKNNIEFEQVTAGPFKRTLTMFGKNTEEGREKLQEDLESIHLLFKDHIQRYRPTIDIERVATGEHWPAAIAYDLKLIDELSTSDDFLIAANRSKNIYELRSEQKKTWAQKIVMSIADAVQNFTIH